MSRNQHFHLGPSLGTSYSPSAEGSAEGDILHGLREDDADIRLGVSAYDLQGLREDDADIRLGAVETTEWDGATGRAEGHAEGRSVRQLGVSAYDRQPDLLVSDGKMGGMVEDHWDVRLSGLREDDANVRLGVSAYDLQGLREDDADVRLGVSAYDLQGLREDDANVRLGGLREDDANVRLGVSAYDLQGLREDDANVRLGTPNYPSSSGSSEGDRAWLGVSAYDRMGVSAYDLGDVDSLNAEAAAIEQGQTLGASGPTGRAKGLTLRAIAWRAAKKALDEARKGLIRSRDEADRLVSAEVEAAAKKMKTALETRVQRFDQVVKEAIDLAMKEYGPMIDKALAGKVSVQGIRMGAILRGLREDDASVRLGRFRAFEVRGSEVHPPEMLAAEGFHERFPVRVDIEGLGRIRFVSTGEKISGLFDFLKPLPSAEEYLGKLRVLIQGWSDTKPRLMALNESSRTSIINQMKALNNDPEKYDGMTAFLNEGYPGLQANPGRWDRVVRLEQYLPTVNTLIAQALSLGPGATLTPAIANAVAQKDLADRQAAMGEASFIEKAAPVAAGVGGAGALTLLMLAIGGVI